MGKCEERIREECMLETKSEGMLFVHSQEKKHYEENNVNSLIVARKRSSRR